MRKLSRSRCYLVLLPRRPPWRKVRQPAPRPRRRDRSGRGTADAPRAGAGGDLARRGRQEAPRGRTGAIAGSEPSAVRRDPGFAGRGRGAARGEHQQRVEVRHDRVLPRAVADVLGAAAQPGPEESRRGRRHRLRTHLWCPTPITSTGVTPTAWSGPGPSSTFITEIRASSPRSDSSYNLTDAGYRRLESNLGINQAFLSINWPELFDDNSRFTLTVGGFTNRYGAAGRYDGGKYEHISSAERYRRRDRHLRIRRRRRVDGLRRGRLGAKLETIPFLAMPTAPSQNLAFNPFPGPVPQESTFVAHAHIGAAYKKMLLLGPALHRHLRETTTSVVPAATSRRRRRTLR